MEFFENSKNTDDIDFSLSLAYSNARWRWVYFDENDMKHNIHIYVNSQPDGIPRGWQIFTSETCLGKFAKLVLDSNFIPNDIILKTDFDRIKEIYDNFDIKQFFDRQKPFRFIGHDENGEFMIADGVHRLTALFILQIIEGKKIVEMPIKWALCGTWQSMEGDFGRIPKVSCPEIDT